MKFLIMSKHYQIRPSDLLSEIMEITDSDRILTDWLSLTDEVQKHLEETLKGTSKKVKREKEKKELREKPPPPQFVNPKHWKNKRWDKWSK